MVVPSQPRLPEMVLNLGASMGRKRLAGPAVVATAEKLRLFPEPRNPLGLNRRWAGHVCHLSASQHPPNDRTVARVPGFRHL